MFIDEHFYILKYLDFKDHVMEKEREDNRGREKNSESCLSRYLLDMTIGGDAEV